jgi:predicted Zn finger-like uncharacterized protein
MLFTGADKGGASQPAMILTCPACETKYVVKDGAIPPGGRQVRCASCKHSWHQDPEAPAGGEADDQSIAEAALIEPRSGPEAEERAYQEAVIADQPGQVPDDLDVAAAPPETAGEFEPAAPPERDQWPDAEAPGEPEAAITAAPAEPAADWLSGSGQADARPEEFEPFYEPDSADTPRRRVPWLVWLLLIVAALAAAGWFLAPASIRERLGMGGAGSTELAVMVTDRSREALASGNELFAVSGRVINLTDRVQQVPPIKAELLDASRQRVVYSWTIAPPAATLEPGASASFNSAEVDVPQGGVYLRVQLDAGAA